MQLGTIDYYYIDSINMYCIYIYICVEHIHVFKYSLNSYIHISYIHLKGNISHSSRELLTRSSVPASQARPRRRETTTTGKEVKDVPVVSPVMFSWSFRFKGNKTR